jgi:hypothetical protein
VQLFDGCYGAGLATTSETARARRTEVPASGDCEITVPFRLLDVCCLTLPTLKPAFFSVRFAFAIVLPTTLGTFGNGLATVSVTVSPTSTLEPGNGDVDTTVPFGAWLVSFVWTLTSRPAACTLAVASSTDIPSTSGASAVSTGEGTGVVVVVVVLLAGDGETASVSVCVVDAIPAPAMIRMSPTTITQNHKRFQNGIDLRGASGGGGGSSMSRDCPSARARRLASYVRNATRPWFTLGDMPHDRGVAESSAGSPKPFEGIVEKQPDRRAPARVLIGQASSPPPFQNVGVTPIRFQR